MDKMTKLEKVALSSAVSGAVFNVFLYGIGATLQTAQGGPLFYARIVAAILQAAAFDLVAIATVMGMRHGRRSRWSMLTAVASALVSAAIALDVAGVASLPWLHAANALIVLAFTLHLLTPPSLDADERQELTRLRQELTGTQKALTECDMLLTAERKNVTALRRELAARPEPETVELVYVASLRLTWPKFAQAVAELRQADDVSMATIRRRVTALALPMTEGE